MRPTLLHTTCANTSSGRLLSPATRRAASVDPIGGRREQCARNSETQSLRGLKVDDKLELTRTLNWQVCRLGTFENLPNIVAAQLVGRSHEVGIVAHQAPTVGVLSTGIHRCYLMTSCQ